VHPNYPDTYMSDPLYLKLGGRLNANTSARLITYDDEQILLAGVTRLRNGQLIEFCDALKERYPQLYSDDLHTAIYDGDMDAFILAWNEVSAYGKAEDFKIAQQNLSARLFYRPVIDGVFKDTGFDWSRTAVREEIMLGIVTTSEQTDWLITFLKYISDDLDPNISDQELLAALKHEDFLYAAAYTYRNYLWRDDPEQMQKDWAISIWSLLNLVEKEYAEDLQQPE